MINIGDKYNYQGTTVTITGTKGDYVLYKSGVNTTGYTGLDAFIAKAKQIVPISTAKTIPKKTLNVSSVGGDTKDPLQLTKTGSTKLYTIVCIIALIIIFFEAKVFKKLIK